jgi:hypothetical protein
LGSTYGTTEGGATSTGGGGQAVVVATVTVDRTTKGNRAIASTTIGDEAGVRQ